MKPEMPKLYTEAELTQFIRDTVRERFTAPWRAKDRITYTEESQLLGAISNAPKNLKQKLRRKKNAAVDTQSK